MNLPIVQIFLRADFALPKGAQALLFAAIATALAAANYRFFERPMTDLRERWR